jgi:hypothetical protein
MIFVLVGLFGYWSTHENPKCGLDWVSFRFDRLTVGILPSVPTPSCSLRIFPQQEASSSTRTTTNLLPKLQTPTMDDSSSYKEWRKAAFSLSVLIIAALDETSEIIPNEGKATANKNPERTLLIPESSKADVG